MSPQNLSVARSTKQNVSVQRFLNNFEENNIGHIRECLDDSHFIKATKGMLLLFSSYYLAEEYFWDNSENEYRIARRQGLGFKHMLSEISSDQVIIYFGRYVDEIRYSHHEHIYVFLDELKAAYDRFNIQLKANKNTIVFLNTKDELEPKHFYSLGFPKHKNKCFLTRPWLRYILGKNDLKGIHIYSGIATTLDFYMYSFWLRRYNDGTIDIAEKVLDFALWSLKNH